jgi:hypothetical protein
MPFLTRNLLRTLSHSLTGILEPHGCAVNRSMLLIGEFIDGGSVRDLPTPAGALRRVHTETQEKSVSLDKERWNDAVMELEAG